MLCFLLGHKYSWSKKDVKYEYLHTEKKEKWKEDSDDEGFPLTREITFFSKYYCERCGKQLRQAGIWW